jgi:hypothetical protein
MTSELRVSYYVVHWWLRSYPSSFPEFSFENRQAGTNPKGFRLIDTKD